MKGISFKRGIGKHANGSYYIRLRVNGKEILKAFPSERAAKNALGALKQRKVAADLGLVVRDSGSTLSLLIDQYIGDAAIRGLAESTLTDYRAVGKRLINHLGKRHSPLFEQSEIMEYVKARRGDGAGAPLITKELKMLGTFLKNTVGISYLVWSIPRLVDATENAPKPIPSDEEVAGVYKALESRPDVQRAFLLGLLTALRPSDVCSLDSGDRTNGVITVGMQKRRGQPVAVPLVKTLTDALKDVEGKLAPSVSAVKMVLQRRKTGWNGFGHLRPVAATWASEAGFSDEDIDALLGHSAWTLARKSYIRSPKLVLADPLIPKRLEMLKAVEKRFLAAL
jgi:integrase